MALQEKLWTVEEFWQQYAGKPFELINGRVIECHPKGYLHGAVISRIGAKLGSFVDDHQLGEVVSAETGFWLNKNTMRAADCAFINKEKVAQITEPEKFLPFAPDLAVEVVSPGDSAGEIQDKVDLYLDGGTALVWVIFPESQKVNVHYPDHTAKTFYHSDHLEGGSILPGLKLPIADLFPPRKDQQS